MRTESIDWAFSDVTAARRLWPRVAELVDAECAKRRQPPDLRARRRITAAVVSELLAEPRRRTGAMPVLSRLAERVRNLLKSVDLLERQPRRHLQTG